MALFFIYLFIYLFIYFENYLAVITRPTKRSAYIEYSSSKTEQGSEGLSGQFIVQYDIDRSLDGGDVLVIINSHCLYRK